MQPKTAINLFSKKHPQKKPIGYWAINDGIIINTESTDGRIEPAQFMVTNQGDMYGVTPIMFGLTPENMTRIKDK